MATCLLLKETIERHGVPLALYSGTASSSAHPKEPREPSRATQG